MSSWLCLSCVEERVYARVNPSRCGISSTQCQPRVKTLNVDLPSDHCVCSFTWGKKTVS